VKFLCEQCKAKYQIADEKVAGKTVRMKCRKCGHLIEVRAVTESSAASFPPPAVAPTAPTPSHRPPPPPRAPPKPSGAKAPFATSLTSAKPAPPKPDRSGRAGVGALAGAFKSTVQHEDEGSAPIDMSELSASDDWYVAVNGVPVGPVRIAEIRRKAALGAVTEDSLAWQEGLDEWRPVRSFPELAAIVREAARSGRLSAPPPPRASLPPPARPMRPSSPGVAAARLASPRPSATGITPAPAAARNNVVPISSRLATAEKIEHAPVDPSTLLALTGETKPAPSVVPDPFGVAGATAAAIAPPGGVAPIVASAALPASLSPSAKKSPPWMAIAMVAAAMSFGAVAGYAIVFRPNPPPSVVVQVPGAAPGPAAPAAATSSGATEPEPAPNPTSLGVRPTIVSGNASKAAPAPSVPSGGGPTGRARDLHSLAGTNSVAPTDDPSLEGPKAPGQCFSEGQVQQVIGLHQLAIRRACWERSATLKATVNISISMTIGSDGSAQSVVASGDDPAIAKCIENDVRGWHFPSMGCSQKTGFSFKFVRQ
jgi:predicted Zn finger-like uncharacterized protein